MNYETYVRNSFAKSCSRTLSETQRGQMLKEWNGAMKIEDTMFNLIRKISVKNG